MIMMYFRTLTRKWRHVHLAPQVIIELAWDIPTNQFVTMAPRKHIYIYIYIYI